ncbi:hypothetical protein GPECTOR_111g255 [Gonium pectorale]|uniref:Uncharacterized protein n=1 Tax=Gonium pectorale TaxID=33097 RepID=A0A150FZ94_GONPE|nr:hypothetical protein GPECTOR_111g255 [Gonium pectorale]|eukprot:KXZ42922.1 hypothetical protein GPECTOR_111g255 [Gonium pectorale]
MAAAALRRRQRLLDRGSTAEGSAGAGAAGSVFIGFGGTGGTGHQSAASTVCFSRHISGGGAASRSGAGGTRGGGGAASGSSSDAGGGGRGGVTGTGLLLPRTGSISRVSDRGRGGSRSGSEGSSDDWDDGDGEEFNVCDLGTLVRSERRRLAGVKSKVSTNLHEQRRYQGLLANCCGGPRMELTAEELTASVIPTPAQPPEGVELKVPDDDIRFSGVRLRFLMGLLEAVESHPVLCRSTAEVVRDLVLPLTAERRCRLLDLAPPEHRGQPHHFICHAWSGSFTQLLQTLRREMLPAPPPPPPPLVPPEPPPPPAKPLGAKPPRTRVGRPYIFYRPDEPQKAAVSASCPAFSPLSWGVPGPMGPPSQLPWLGGAGAGSSAATAAATTATTASTPSGVDRLTATASGIRSAAATPGLAARRRLAVLRCADAVRHGAAYDQEPAAMHKRGEPADGRGWRRRRWRQG